MIVQSSITKIQKCFKSHSAKVCIIRILWPSQKTQTLTFSSRDLVLTNNIITVMHEIVEFKTAKGGLIPESFSLLLKSPKNVPSHSPEYLFFRLDSAQESDLAPFF